MNAITVASFDPSTSCTGFALGSVDPARVKILERGRVIPKGSAKVEQRIDQTAGEIDDLFAAWRDRSTLPDVVLIEAPKKPQHREQARASLWAFARGVGAVEGVASLWARKATKDRPMRIERADPNDWTRIAGTNWSKERRLQLVASVEPDYLIDRAAGRDPGGDMGDAIAILLLWAMRSRAVIAEMLAKAKGVA